MSGSPLTAGAYNFTIKVTDNAGWMASQSYTVVVCRTITVNPATIPNGFIGTPYNHIFTATDGRGTILPSRRPETPFNATDTNGCLGERAYTIIISGNGLQFYPLAAPVRLLDTRPGASPNACSQPNAPIPGQTSRTQPGRNLCTIPAQAQALTGNVTTVDSSGGFLTLYPSDATRPTVASTNYGVNEVINNVFTVGLGADGAFKIFANHTTDVVVDATGYYAPPNTGGLYFHPLPSPVRLLETGVDSQSAVSNRTRLCQAGWIRRNKSRASPA